MQKIRLVAGSALLGAILFFGLLAVGLHPVQALGAIAAAYGLLEIVCTFLVD